MKEETSPRASKFREKGANKLSQRSNTFIRQRTGRDSGHDIELMSMEKLTKIIKTKEGKLAGYERCDAY
jgi:hypothetical protein